MITANRSSLHYDVLHIRNTATLSNFVWHAELHSNYYVWSWVTDLTIVLVLVCQRACQCLQWFSQPLMIFFEMFKSKYLVTTLSNSNQSLLRPVRCNWFLWENILASRLPDLLLIERLPSGWDRHSSPSFQPPHQYQRTREREVSVLNLPEKQI